MALILAMAATLSGAAAERTETKPAQTVVDDSLSIAFVEGESGDGSMLPAGNDAWLDLKQVSRMAGSKEKVIRKRRRIGVRVVRAGGVAGGTAAISVHLDSWDGRATYRLDGRQLTAAPLVVDAHAPVGSVTFHTLEIEVPTTVAEGPLTAAITWEVTTD
ncbi:MAG: hypothetical protein JOZ54_06405 [Acidobacteria bacterium]|nr:hypothetical protein [Acidobacteriota bacterium]